MHHFRQNPMPEDRMKRLQYSVLLAFLVVLRCWTGHLEYPNRLGGAQSVADLNDSYIPGEQKGF
jgi:hypothetical protein